MDQKNRQLRTGLSDIVATNDDPTENVNTVTNVVFVMKEGVVYN
jgi:imidazolonepropionase-like amidohydrolase